MASGSVRQYFQGSKYYLDTVWSSTEDISANTSDVEVKLYVGAVSGWSAYGSNGTWYIRIDGTTYSGSSFSYSLNGSRTLVSTKTKTVSHDTDGTKSITIATNFDGNAYLGSGSDSFTATLDTIPRKSKMTSSPSWEAGSNFTINISRYSSKFRHEAEIYIKHKTTGDWEHVKQVVFDAGDTSESTAFSTANNEELYDHLDGNSSRDSYIILQTYNGSTHIGSNYYYGTITAKPSSTVSSSASFNIGDPVDVSISRDTSAFTHTVRFYVNNTLIKTLTGVGASTTWTPTTTEKNNMYQQTINSNSTSSKIEVDTYYASEMVRSTRSRTGTAYVKNSNPTFTGTGITYKDSNTTTSGLTGSDQYIIQKKSTVQVVIPAANRATGTNYATMVNYTATLNGVSVTQNWSSTNAITFNMGTVDSKSDVTLSIKAKDSRGNTTTITKIIKMLPYLPPVALPSIDRLNGFEAPTAINITGSFYPLSIGGAVKNALTPIAGQTSAIQYRYKENISSASFPSTWTNMTFPAPTSAGKFTANTATATLDVGKAFVFEIRVSDKLSTETFTIVVGKGTPIFAISSTLNSIGFNSTPTQKDTFEMFGKMLFDRSKYATGTSNDAPINFNNSDAIGLNGLFFNDLADNNGEGVLFPKTGAVMDYDKPFNLAQWNNFRILDDVVYLDGRPMYHKNAVIVWSGMSMGTNTGESAFRLGGGTTNPTINALDYAPNGIMFIFSDHDYVAGGTNTSNDFNWVHIPVPRWQLENQSGKGISMAVAAGNTTSTNAGVYANKYFYVTPTGFTGHSDNSSGDAQRDVCLRFIITY